MKAGALLAKYGTGAFYELGFERGSFSYLRKAQAEKEDTNLDGIYILRLSIPKEAMKVGEVVRAYHNLSEVETAFLVSRLSTCKSSPSTIASQTEFGRTTTSSLLRTMQEWSRRSSTVWTRPYAWGIPSTSRRL